MTSEGGEQAGIGRRLVLPALVSGVAWLLIVAVHSASQMLRERHVEAILNGTEGFPSFLLVLPLGWLALPLIFVAVHLCRTRGGETWEYILVGCVPLILAIWVAAPSLVDLVRSTPDTATLGTRTARAQDVASFVEWAALCAVALWLYSFARRHLREDPSACGRAPAAAEDATPPPAVNSGDE